MLRFRLHMEFDPQKFGEVSSVLRSILGPVRAEQGCLMTRIQQGSGEGCEISWIEEWNSIEDFEFHLRAEAFRQILAVVEMAAVKPVFEIDDVCSRRGFELVEEILARTENGERATERV